VLIENNFVVLGEWYCPSGSCVGTRSRPVVETENTLLSALPGEIDPRNLLIVLQTAHHPIDLARLIKGAGSAISSLPPPLLRDRGSRAKF